jgi:hypothetical protein
MAPFELWYKNDVATPGVWTFSGERCMQTERREADRSQTRTPVWRLPARLYREGLLAGCLGGATVALWFLMLDTLAGHPLYTPAVLGTALFEGPAALGRPTEMPMSVGMVVAFSCVHWLIFAAIGGIAAWLLTFAEYNRSLGFGLLFLFLWLVFEFGFLAAAMFFSDALLIALDWKMVLAGNLLAAASMGVYLWWRHPFLEMRDIKEAFFS